MHRSGDKQKAPVHLFLFASLRYIDFMKSAIVLLAFLPIAQNAQDPPVRIIIEKSKYTLSVFRADSFLVKYKIAIGENQGDKQRVGDKRTPVGEFRISQIQRSASWVHDFGDGRGPIAGAYGPWFLRLETPGWTGIGIHGTHDPSSLGTMVTEGCIRLSNDHIAELKKLVTIGTSVRISP